MKKRFTTLLLLLMFLTLSANAQNLLKGNWLLVSMTDEKGAAMALPEKKEITLNFADSTIGARVCNSISGKYSIKKNQKIKIDFKLSTMMYCPELATEQAFTRLAESATDFSVRKNELILSGKKSKPTLRFTKIISEKSVGVNGKWQLISMKRSGKLIPLIGKAITLNIDKDKIGGSGGCNSYGGSFSQEGKIVRFSEIFSTKMWCDNGATENQYFQTLEESVNYELKNGQLILTDELKKNTLIFKESKN